MPVLIFASCEDENIEGDCGPKAVISPDFGTATSDPFTIVSAQVDGHCLNVEISAGGCDGESWTAELLASEVITAIFPSQVGLKLILNDDELCEAAIRKTFSFDLQSLRQLSTQMILYLEGWDEPLQYPNYDIQNLLGEWNLMNINGGLAGLNNQFEQKGIIWNFSASNVTITNSNQDPNKYSGFESGTYEYSVKDSEFTDTKVLEIDGQTLGR
ncbi:MAG: hypothetical protein AAF391_08740, partial [Bacteroidota bacterium]